MVAAWLSGNGIAHINKVTLRWAQLVLGWLTVSLSHVCTILVSNQPPRLIQPGHPFAGRCNGAMVTAKAREEMASSANSRPCYQYCWYIDLVG